MRSVLRRVAAGVATLATFYFMYWMGGALLYPAGLPALLAPVGALVCSALVARFVWRRTGSSAGGPASFVFAGALMVGALGFIAGFFGPMLLTPEANQGPLLGLFITGPAGLVLGAVGGGIVWRGRRARDG